MERKWKYQTEFISGKRAEAGSRKKKLLKATKEIEENS